MEAFGKLERRGGGVEKERKAGGTRERSRLALLKVSYSRGSRLIVAECYNFGLTTMVNSLNLPRYTIIS